MELSHLKFFLTVARKGNLSAAAKELGTTQPNLGRQMTALAKEVGMDLFVRHSRGMDLTVRGKEFFDLCQRIVGELEQETVSIREQDSEPQGSLKLVTGIGTVEGILKRVHSFRTKFPKVQFSFNAIVDIINVDPFQFQIGDADVAYLPKLFNDPDLIQHQLLEMSVRWYAAPRYLKEHIAPKNLEDLRDHKLIAFRGELESLVSSLKLQGTLAQIIQVNNGVNMGSALMEGLGIGSYFYDKEILEQNLLVDIFPDMPSHKVPYYFTYHKRLEGSPKVQAFYEFMQEIVGIWKEP